MLHEQPQGLPFGQCIMGSGAMFFSVLLVDLSCALVSPQDSSFLLIVTQVGFVA